MTRVSTVWDHLVLVEKGFGHTELQGMLDDDVVWLAEQRMELDKAIAKAVNPKGDHD